MKKYIIIVLLMTVGMTLSAQKYINPNSPYHRVGDTIDNTCPIYHFQWWPDQFVRDSHEVDQGASIATGAGGIRLQYNYVEHPVDVVGIGTGISIFEGFSEFPQLQEYVMLYEATDSSFELKAQVPITDYTPEYPHRYIKMPTNPWGFVDIECEVGHQTEEVFFFKEFYFDSAVTVRDSFYVGATSYSTLVTHPDIESFAIDINKDGSRVVGLTNAQHLDCEEADNPIWKSYGRYTYANRCFTLTPNFDWRWEHIPFFLMVFPIIDIKVDTTPPACPMVGGVHVASQMLDLAVLAWDRHEYFDGYQVAFGHRGTDPDSCRIINVRDTTLQLHLDDSSVYVAYVRAKCVFDTVGPWSAPRFLYMGMDITQDDQDGILEADMPRLSASPNPSTGMVRLSASEPVYHVEVFDMSGMRVYTADCPPMAMEMRLDLGRLPSGTYVVRAKTKSSEASTKVILER